MLFFASSKGRGFGAGTTSCKRHEMSSKKCVGRGGLRETYLPEEGEVRVRVGFIFVEEGCVLALW